MDVRLALSLYPEYLTPRVLAPTHPVLWACPLVKDLINMLARPHKGWNTGALTSPAIRAPCLW